MFASRLTLFVHWDCVVQRQVAVDVGIPSNCFNYCSTNAVFLSGSPVVFLQGSVTVWFVVVGWSHGAPMSPRLARPQTPHLCRMDLIPLVLSSLKRFRE